MAALVRNKQIMYLFLSNVAILFVGMGLFPILPLNAARYGATNSQIGLYFAVIYLFSALGPITTGWLTRRFSMKKVFVVTGGLGVPSLFLMGAASTLIEVIVYTGLLWYFGGVLLALSTVFTSGNTNETSRGKAFSLLSVAAPVGALVGGIVIGQLISWQGYPSMFYALGVLWIVVPFIGQVFLKDPSGFAPTTLSKQRARTSSEKANWKPDLNFTILLAVSLLASMAINISRLGTSISMQSLNFTAEQVSSTSVIAGLVSIPITLVIGVLSDRLGRKHLLAAGFLFSLSGSLVLLTAHELWQFWTAAMLHMMALSVNAAMGLAVANDVLPDKAVGVGLPMINMINSAANIICFAVSGLMIDRLGMNTVYLTAALLALISVVLLEGALKSQRQTAPAIPVKDQPATCESES